MVGGEARDYAYRGPGRGRPPTTASARGTHADTDLRQPRAGDQASRLAVHRETGNTDEERSHGHEEGGTIMLSVLGIMIRGAVVVPTFHDEDGSAAEPSSSWNVGTIRGRE